MQRTTRGARIAVIGHRAASCDRRVMVVYIYGYPYTWARPLRRLGYIAMDHAMHPKYPCVVGSGVFFGVQQRPLPLRARVLLGRLIHNTRHGAMRYIGEWARY